MDFRPHRPDSRLLRALPFALITGALVPSSAAGSVLDPVSPNSQDTELLLAAVGGVGLLLVLIAAATFVMALARASRSDTGTEATSQANAGRFQTRLLIVVVAVVAALGAFGTVTYSQVESPDAPSSGAETLQVNANGQQYLWRYTYKGTPVFSYHRLVVPEDTTVMLDLTSQDVTHSWWVPSLGGKFDAVPGYTNKTWFRADEQGVYKGACSELCGPNHASMTTEVEVVDRTTFDAWMAEQTQAIDDARTQLKQSREQL